MTHEDIRRRMIQGTLPSDIYDGVVFYKLDGKYVAKVGEAVVATASTLKDCEIIYIGHKLEGRIV